MGAKVGAPVLVRRKEQGDDSARCQCLANEANEGPGCDSKVLSIVRDLG
jgi:hypothetical protein